MMLVVAMGTHHSDLPLQAERVTAHPLHLSCPPASNGAQWLQMQDHSSKTQYPPSSKVAEGPLVLAEAFWNNGKDSN